MGTLLRSIVGKITTLLFRVLVDACLAKDPDRVVGMLLNSGQQHEFLGYSVAQIARSASKEQKVHLVAEATRLMKLVSGQVGRPNWECTDAKGLSLCGSRVPFCFIDSHFASYCLLDTCRYSEDRLVVDE